MAIVLTVDDSRAIRMIVSKMITEMGLQVDEAEDGEQGLAKLEEVEYDLIILDVTMPVLDGPGMLSRLRAAGKTTPVLMLTSESKRSIVAELMKLKIEDYILKPFKNDELKAKIVRILKQKTPDVLQSLAVEGAASAVAAAAAAVAPPRPKLEETPTARQFADVLVIDDMENVQKKLRTMLPPHLTMQSSINGQAALKLAREATFRLILIDRELPDITGPALVKQLRVLQPGAACLAMTLRSSNNVSAEVKEEGFDDVLFKPFNEEALQDMLQTYFQGPDLMTRENELLSATAYNGRPERVDRYYSRLGGLVKTAIKDIAEACFEQVIFDASKLPPDETRLPQLIMQIEAAAKSLGLGLSVVGPDAVSRSLKDFAETKEVATFRNLDEARQRAA